MRLKHGPHHSIGGNGRRHAGVGGAQHGTSRFQRTHAGNLQMLAQGPRIPEPGQIADVHQHAGATAGHVASDALYDFFAENVLIADIGGHHLTRDRHGRLAEFASVEIAERYGHGVHEPAESGRHEFPEGHEVDLVVAERKLSAGDGFEAGVGPECDSAVGIAITAADAVMQGNAHQEGRATFSRHIEPAHPDLRMNAVLKQGYDGFGKDGDVGLFSGFLGRHSGQHQVIGNPAFDQFRIEFF